MPRPPLPIGTWGKIRSYPTHHNSKGKPDRFRAVAQYRDHDGRTRQVAAYGKTGSAAEQALRQKLKDRSATSRKGELTSMHRFSTAAELWLGRISTAAAEGRRSPGTLRTYRSYLDKHVLPALGDVRLGEVTTPLLDRVIGTIKAEVSGSSAKTCRSIISGILGLAVRYGAMTSNPVREVERLELSRKEARALTEDERRTWFAQLRADPAAVRKDLPDLTAFMLATGVRIGEALAVLWSQVDFDAGTVEVTHTIIRVKGEGLLRKQAKTRAGERLLPLPRWALSMLRSRFMVGVRLDDPVFPNTLGGLRDPSGVHRDIRQAREHAGLVWITAHNLRKTTATILDEAGLSARQVADQLGHARVSITQDVYLGRRLASRRAAEALERALDDGPKDEKRE
jgi:integrase